MPATQTTKSTEPFRELLIALGTVRFAQPSFLQVLPADIKRAGSCMSGFDGTPIFYSLSIDLWMGGSQRCIPSTSCTSAL
mmetsp:Transcript_31642/g.96842  ORF Transcript_31642/g.96842 Transcript_31642/m.96842 type:complete len:80 (-) Transcript_31642:367-606(-)